ncbi:16S rRNA (cytosine(1402)-N(4))-methyltransferase RsmH [Candidatus Kaiserbacteria bacterium]|nr:16S rRNA (cytosine(1402)-N(4))-methyltransferase RsmH [Candidatus Kaiserbacteria bacterium]
MHRSVLLQETIDSLDIKKDDVVVDATFGGGGHSRAILERLGKKGVLVAIDTDLDALEKGKETLGSFPARTFFKEANFRAVDRVLDECGIKEADKFLFDLGMSSDQLEKSGRGFSFRRKEPLVMTLSGNVDKTTLTAERIVNEWSESQIATIIRGYGEEAFSKRIAKAIVDARKVKRIKNTEVLAQIVKSAVPLWYRRRRIHPATKTFQALRIAVNDEIDALREGLQKAQTRLAKDGRIATITFHSIEDRAVKRLFQGWKKDGTGEPLFRKPIVPSRTEIRENPRARSAKLRTFKKYDNTNTKHFI